MYDSNKPITWNSSFGMKAGLNNNPYSTENKTCMHGNKNMQVLKEVGETLVKT